MTWNHRVIKFYPEGQDPYYAIHEIYYDDEGIPWAFTKNPASVVWDNDETFESPRFSLDSMRKALDLPILEEKDFVGKPDLQE